MNKSNVQIIPESIQTLQQLSTSCCTRKTHDIRKKSCRVPIMMKTPQVTHDSNHDSSS